MSPWTDKLPVLLLLPRPVARCRERSLNWLRHEIEYAQPQTTQTSAKKFWGDVTGRGAGRTEIGGPVSQLNPRFTDRFPSLWLPRQGRFPNLSFSCT